MFQSGLPKKKTLRTYNFNAGWKKIGHKEIYFRSQWEMRYAQFLQWQLENKLIKDWQYEPKTFWFEQIKRGVRSYKPDFYVVANDDTHFWVEVKGYMDKKSKTKISRFRRYYPEEILQVVGKEWFVKKNFIFYAKKS